MLTILKQTIITILTILFLVFFTALASPNGSQNYSQFLTGIVCARANSDLCNRKERTILRVIETQESVVYRLDPISDSAHDNFVEIGKVNAGNALRDKSPYEKYFKFHANFWGGADVTLLQLRVFFANSLLVVLIVCITISVLSMSQRRWFLGVLGFAIVGGDSLPNSVSLAPIGVSSVSFLCAVALAVSVINIAPDTFRTSLLNIFRIMLLCLFVLIVSWTRNDQMMLLGVLIVACVLQKTYLLLKNWANKTTVTFQLIQWALVVGAVIPGLVFVQPSGFWQVVPPSTESSGTPVPSSTESSVPLLESLVVEIVKSPYYFAQDFAPSWTDLFSSQVVKGVVGVIYLGFITPIIWHFLTAKYKWFLLAVGATACLYVVSYGIIWGPRAELRYIWQFLLGIMISLLFSNDYNKESSEQIHRLLTAGFMTAMSLNLLALISKYDTAKHFWWSDSNRSSGTIFFSITVVLGFLLSATYVRHMSRQKTEA